jgi:hypothetical protein
MRIWSDLDPQGEERGAIVKISYIVESKRVRVGSLDTREEGLGAIFVPHTDDIDLLGKESNSMTARHF